MRIEHLAIVISDLQRAKDFFCTYFGGVVLKPDYHNPHTGYTIKSAPRTTGDGYYESVIIPFDGIELEITI